MTGRSRLALYLARIPAGLAIVVPLVAAGFIIVCSVCVFAAPTRLNYDGTNVPAGLSRSAFESWAGEPSETGHLRLRLLCRTVFSSPRVINSVRVVRPHGRPRS